jgi:acetyl esterase/lipase
MSTSSTERVLLRPADLDPELAASLASLAANSPALPPVARGDWQAQRHASNGFYDLTIARAAAYAPVQVTEYATQAADGTTIALRWHRPAGTTSGAAVVYVHGGGMIAGTLAHADALARRYVQAAGVPFLTVDYRLAPEVQGRTSAEDVYASLRWLVDHATQLGVDPGRIAVMGDNAGGGIAAGVAILARERHLALAHQLLLYPMLDDRTGVAPLDARLHDAPILVYDAVYTGWQALLGHEPGSASDLDPAAVPARLTEYTGLAPAYVEAADLDALRYEAIAYAQHLAQAGVPVEFHLYPGVPHGFDFIAPQAAITQRAVQNRLRVLQAL